MHFHTASRHTVPLLSPVPAVPGGKQLPLGIVLSSREEKMPFFGLQFASQMDQSLDLSPSVDCGLCQHSVGTREGRSQGTLGMESALSLVRYEYH